MFVSFDWLDEERKFLKRVYERELKRWLLLANADGDYSGFRTRFFTHRPSFAYASWKDCGFLWSGYHRSVDLTVLTSP